MGENTGTKEKLANIAKKAKASKPKVKKIEDLPTYKDENLLNKIIFGLEKIPNFNNAFESIMGRCKQNNENLSVFYEDDILTTLKDNETSIKNENGLYYVWSGKFWKSLEPSTLKRFIKTYIKKRGLMSHRNSNIVEGTFKNIAITFGGIAHKVESDIQRLNLDNGVLSISKESITFGTHKKDYNLNYCLDFDYNPEAVNSLWLSFLDDVLPSKETQKTLQQVIGNLLIRGLKIEVLPFLYGTGGNGKSVVLEVLSGLFGTENVTTYSLTKITTDERVRARIADGKIMNLSSENNMGNVNVDVAKSYSSCEPLEARLNYGNPFEIYDYAKFLGNVNRLNVMDGERTHAIARRQIIIPFLVAITPDKMDVNLHYKILKNKSGLLNWILEGIKEVVKNNEIYKSPEVKNLLAKYQEDTNPVHQMIIENGYKVLDKSVGKIHYISLKDLYKEYTEFSQEIGVGRLSRNNFKADLLTLKGVYETKSQNKTVFNLSRLMDGDHVNIVVEDKNGVVTKDYIAERQPEKTLL